MRSVSDPSARKECYLPASDAHDGDDVSKSGKIVRIAGAQRKIRRRSYRRCEQIDGPGPACLSTPRHNRCIDPSVCACGVRIEWDRIECCLGPLQSVLSPGSFIRVGSGVGTSRQLGHGDPRGDAAWQHRHVDVFEIYHDRCVKNPTFESTSSHGDRSQDRQLRRGRLGSGRRRSPGRCGTVRQPSRR